MASFFYNWTANSRELFVKAIQEAAIAGGFETAEYTKVNSTTHEVVCKIQYPEINKELRVAIRVANGNLTSYSDLLDPSDSRGLHDLGGLRAYGVGCTVSNTAVQLFIKAGVGYIILAWSTNNNTTQNVYLGLYDHFRAKNYGVWCPIAIMNCPLTPAYAYIQGSLGSPNVTNSDNNFIGVGSTIYTLPSTQQQSNYGSARNIDSPSDDYNLLQSNTMMNSVSGYIFGKLYDIYFTSGPNIKTFDVIEFQAPDTAGSIDGTVMDAKDVIRNRGGRAFLVAKTGDNSSGMPASYKYQFIAIEMD